MILSIKINIFWIKTFQTYFKNPLSNMIIFTKGATINKKSLLLYKTVLHFIGILNRAFPLVFSLFSLSEQTTETLVS